MNQYGNLIFCALDGIIYWACCAPGRGSEAGKSFYRNPYFERCCQKSFIFRKWKAPFCWLVNTISGAHHSFNTESWVKVPIRSEIFFLQIVFNPSWVHKWRTFNTFATLQPSDTLKRVFKGAPICRTLRNMQSGSSGMCDVSSGRMVFFVHKISII